MFRLSTIRNFAAALFITLSSLGASHALAQAVQPAASVAAPETAAASAKETVDNPYGIDALWKGGDAVAKGTLAILLIMSFGSWLIIFTKLYEQQKLAKQGKKANETFWVAGGVEQAIDSLEPSSAYHFIARSGSEATANHRGLLGYIDLNDWIQLSIHRSIENIQSRLQDGLAFLATVGSTAPFVGLFGTVWGIYHALTAIGIAGQASIDKVAGPVGEALIMTAIGLAVAVPAVLGYNWLVRRNKSALDGIRTFGAELHAVLLGAAAERRDQRSPAVVQSIRAISF
ncbi:MotA/TolQ/ExbB proton channel family protein [Dechloromonas denitrificans]|uniref:MotA/TolQ/ExbB proton channel family protein n=1 Tax=Dechloromonas denitrificans TaxID=281362 RepID=UPI001CF83FAB|nr:MotA/TolQ/ExbB proton channel family protein [Dechloromonas denitrificans]UCV05592.1 MotA/TolQ/ExbB proton channel family protein [Dechloromonas denitrificans]UCV09940.1 MotA/TolQ/ExbB proton channel family protein [Dechloromonas denitrificans]